MKLIELKPEWRENPPGNKYLRFNCPTCPADKSCIITIAVDNTIFPDKTWHSRGLLDFDLLSLQPSLAHQCTTNPHFFITNGEIKMA